MLARPTMANNITVDLPGTTRYPPPLSLYIHLPWCARKCPYCDFNSHKKSRHLPENDYIHALLADAETLLPLIWGRRIQTVFIGGGTPSLFSPAAIDKLLCGLRALSLLSMDGEITMEANPDSSESVKFKEFAAAGINRLSLGAQSFDDDSLAALGRAHDSRAARKAATIAAEIFNNFNLDIMYALPGQNIDKALQDIKIALSFAPPHLSLYQLTLEPGTPFFRFPPPRLPSDDDAAAIGDAAMQAVINHHYQRYEISAFAAAGKECHHNLNYWQFGDYAGIGAGAHSKITLSGKIYRYARIKHPAEYMRRAITGDAVSEKRIINHQERVFEFMLNALRLPSGFTIESFYERTGMQLPTKIINQCEQEGLLATTVERVYPTEKGLRYLNNITEKFLPKQKRS